MKWLRKIVLPAAFTALTACEPANEAKKIETYSTQLAYEPWIARHPTFAKYKIKDMNNDGRVDCVESWYTPEDPSWRPGDPYILKPSHVQVDTTILSARNACGRRMNVPRYTMNAQSIADWTAQYDSLRR